MIEKWLPIPEFPGYEISDTGRVRSYFGRSSRKRRKRGVLWEIKDSPQRVLKPSLVSDPPGYHGVNLRRDGESHYMKISHLVLLAFVGPRPEGMDTCHTNDKSTDDRLENLRYDTHKNNLADTPSEKWYPKEGLTEQQVIEIRQARADGKSYQQIAKENNVPCSTIGQVCIGGTYANWGGPITKKRKTLSCDDVRSIRLMREKGQALLKIAKVYGVCESMVSRICSGQRYGYIKG